MCNNDKKLVLIVEDSDDDFMFTERALKETNFKNPIVRCVDGQDALDYIFTRGKYDENRVLPGLILLDLNMPGIGGEEVLSEVKGSEELKYIPVIVLTTSADEQDIDGCYKKGANTYIQKPVDLDKLFQAVKHMKEYWFEIAVLPKH